MLWFFSLAFAQDTVAPQEKAEIDCSDLHWNSGRDHCVSKELEEISVAPRFEIPEPIYAPEPAPQLRVGAAGAWTYNETSYTPASELQSFVNASVIGFGAGHFYVYSKTGDQREGNRAAAIFGLEAITATAMGISAGNLAFPSIYADKDYAIIYSSTLGVSAVAFSLTRIYELVDAPAAARRANDRANEIQD